MKRVLVVSYSQSGQLHGVVDSVLEPLHASVHHEILQPQPAFPFPWSLRSFLDVFPESVRLEPCGLAPLGIAEDAEFDLVILAYQVWFLAPAQPMTAFLKSPAARRLLKGKPVVTIIACRNMWLTAQETVKRLIAEAGGRLKDNIVLTDRANALATFISTPRWLLTGRRDRFLGLPPAGVPQSDIDGCRRFGVALSEALANDGEAGSAPMLSGLRAVEVEPRLIMSERAGSRAFRVWSAIIRKFGPPGGTARQCMLLVFVCYLIAMIITIVPLSLLLQKLLRPLLAGRIGTLKNYYEQPSGSQDFRMVSHD